MPLPSINTFVDSVLQSRLLDAEQCAEVQRLQPTCEDARALAQELLRRDWFTAYQINQIFQGKGDDLSLGPFTLLERVGEGGMGQVFKARQKVLQRVVALKVIRKECLKNPKVTLRFQREIRAAGQLNHPHIVRAYDADQINGTYYIAMEYIEGVDLAKLVKDEGPLRVDRACEYIRQAALGLQHAFERGLVHRDIKPANLLVTRAVSSDRRRSSGFIKRPLPAQLDERKRNTPPRLEVAQAYPWGVVKILDMGLSRCNDSLFGRASTHLTQVGSVMGTPEYIAPEQARDSHTSDVRADLYSLGCTLYFLLTGQAPFPEGTLTEKLLQHQFEPVPPVGLKRRERLGPVADEAVLAVPGRVEELIHKLMAKLPNDRYQTPIELANELQAIVQGLANGTLQSAEPAKSSTMAVPLATPVAAKPSADDSTVITAQVVVPRVEPRRTRSLATKLAVLLAAGGSLALLLIATVIGVLLSRTSLMQASDTPHSPPAKVKDGDNPTGKRPTIANRPRP